nr:hypothetical protein [Actinomycetales bacterium]
MNSFAGAQLRDLMVLLRDWHAFSGGRAGSELPPRHVPFDQLTGTHAFEEAIAREWRGGSVLVIRGEPGSGKSSALEFVLGEGEAEFLPLRLRLGQRSDVAAVTDPAAFARHLASVIAFMADDVAGAARMNLERELRPRQGSHSDRVGASFNLGLVRLDIAREVQSVARAGSEIDDVERARTLLDVLREDGRHIVLLLDDLDHWFAADLHGETAATTRDAFMTRIMRFLPELGVAAGIAAQPRHTSGDSWTQARDFVHLVLDVPQLPDAPAVRALLERRLRVALQQSNHTITASDAHGLAAQIFTAEAVEELLGVARSSPNRVRKMLSAADRALGLAVDDGVMEVSDAAVKSAWAAL